MVWQRGGTGNKGRGGIEGLGRKVVGDTQGRRDKGGLGNKVWVVTARVCRACIDQSPDADGTFC